MRPPDSWKTARGTLVIAALTAFAWLGAGALGWNSSGVAAIWAGFIPARVGGALADGALAPVWLTPLTATLVHGGLVHLAFNLLMLLFCGRSTETILGTRGLVILYLIGAYAAAAAQFAAGPGDLSPMIGASGSISAVLGAYALLFGRNKVRVADPRLALALHSLWLAAAWVALQLLIGFTFEVPGARIAIAAHIGGFLAGLILAKPLLILRYRKA